MSLLQLGDEAPDFTAQSTQGELRFREWQDDSWVVLFAHPADFTPVCTTELAAVAALDDQWRARNVKPVALSIDDVNSHNAWLGDVCSFARHEVNFPVIADRNRNVADLYGMIHPSVSELLTIRALFIIDPDHLIRFITCYPNSTGRNFDEVLRVIDSLQLAAEHKLADSAGWVRGKKAIVPLSIDDAQARDLFGEVTIETPYYRVVTPPRNF